MKKYRVTWQVTHTFDVEVEAEGHDDVKKVINALDIDDNVIVYSDDSRSQLLDYTERAKDMNWSHVRELDPETGDVKKQNLDVLLGN